MGGRGARDGRPRSCLVRARVPLIGRGGKEGTLGRCAAPRP
jgi:hypothetical protein